MCVSTSTAKTASAPVQTQPRLRSHANGAAATLTFGLAFLTFGIVGALVASRVPGNALGWIFIAIGVVSAAVGPAGGYAKHGLVDDPGSLPGLIDGCVSPDTPSMPFGRR